MNKKVVRKNITMSQEIADIVEERSRKYGITQSSIFVSALVESLKNEEIVKSMGNLPEIMNKLQEIQNKQGELQAEAPRPVVETKCL